MRQFFFKYNYIYHNCQISLVINFTPVKVLFQG